LRAQGVTVLITTHYMDEAQRLCDEVAIFSAGKVIRAGAPESLIAALATETIELDCSPEEEAALLDGFAPLARTIRIGRRLMLYLDRTTGFIEHVRRFDHGDRRALVVRPTNLEDVFLSLTGTSLEVNR
jgi:ABC-type multidrug transport system ATPase subunit